MKQTLIKILLFFRDLFLHLCVRVDVSCGRAVSKEDEGKSGDEDSSKEVANDD